MPNGCVPWVGRRLGIVLLALLPVGCLPMTPPTPVPAEPVPPVAEIRPYAVESPNGSRIDNYYWLRDDTRADPAMLAYLAAENTYYAAMTGHTHGLEDRLYAEIVGRIKQDDATVPAKDRHYEYWVRYDTGGEYPVHMRRHLGEGQPDHVMLDGNRLAEGHDFFQVSGLRISPDERLLAYGEDLVGRRQFVIHIKDLSTGEILPDALPGASASIAWADDSRTLFYVENDPVTLLTTRVKRHVLGTDPASDTIVYEEKDHSFYMQVGRTGDDRYVTIDLHSTLSSETRFLPAARPDGKFAVLLPRESTHEYEADHIGQRWIIRSNWKAPNFRLMALDDKAVGDKRHWHELVPGSDSVFIGGFELFRHHLAIAERSQGLQRIRIKPWGPGADSYVAVDDAVYTATLGDNREQDTDTLRYSVSSPITPTTVYDLDMGTGARTLRKRDTVPGGFDPALYQTERVWVTARDGTAVPVSLAYRKDTKRDGTAPLYQYAYGAYGLSSDPYFVPARISLLDRGFVVAIAHIRGGEEMGRAWYEGGRLLNKKNSFTDFIDVTYALVAQHYAAADKVFAMGGSAGGLLMGAVANMAPEAYRGIIAKVPFVDIVTTMLDESIPLTTNEFDEWGNPKQAIYYNYMLSYSPYDNIAAKPYPAMLVTTGLWDSQVQYYEPAKFVAKLRATKTDHNPLLFKINMEAGHGGKSGRFQKFRETAEEYAFILDRLGIDR